LLRGKSGRLVGNLTSVLVLLKGLPSSYDKDLQEDKEPLFDAVETLSVALSVAAGALQTLTIRPDRMAASLGDELLATDLADLLVRRGVPFRESHHIVGRVVRRAEELGRALRELSDEDLCAIDQRLVGSGEVWDFERSVEQRAAIGGTARAALLAQMEELNGSG
jgi:argininosuccinate lyase